YWHKRRKMSPTNVAMFFVSLFIISTANDVAPGTEQNMRSLGFLLWKVATTIVKYLVVTAT
ncbi:hypothetical protein HID58_057635, partial [Brassica napus]